MELGLHGDGAAGEFRIEKIGREGYRAFARIPRLHAFDQGFKIRQGLALAEGELEVVGLDAGNGRALFINGLEVDHGDVVVNRGAGLAHGDDLGHVEAHALDNGADFFLIDLGFFLFHLKTFVGGQIKGRHHLKGDGVDKVRAALHVAAVIVDARNRHQLVFGDDFIDVHIDQIRRGFLVYFRMEAFFDDARRHFALAEPVKGDGGAVHGDGGGQSRVALFGGNRDGDLLFDRSKVFGGILHRYGAPWWGLFAVGPVLNAVLGMSRRPCPVFPFEDIVYQVSFRCGEVQ